MTNELRKTLGRNMRYVQMNRQLDEQIKQLEKQAPYNINVQAQISDLEQQKTLNKQQMYQPMSEK